MTKLSSESSRLCKFDSNVHIISDANSCEEILVLRLIESGFGELVTHARLSTC